jgi:hypothetical protein
VAFFLLAPEFAAFPGFANPAGRPTRAANVASRFENNMIRIWEIPVGEKRRSE